jgi:hypothetical protein
MHDNFENYADSEFDRNCGWLLGLGTELDKNDLAQSSTASWVFPYAHCDHWSATALANERVQDIFQNLANV